MERHQIVLTGITGRKIAAIKALRVWGNVGLREAKIEWADAAERGERPVLFESEDFDIMQRRYDDLRDADFEETLVFHVNSTFDEEHDREDDYPTPIFYEAAIWIARDLPITPDDLVRLANYLDLTGEEPTFVLRKIATIMKAIN